MNEGLRCVPCGDRGIKTPATRQVTGEPWCEECFGGKCERDESKGEELSHQVRQRGRRKIRAADVPDEWREFFAKVAGVGRGQVVPVYVADGKHPHTTENLIHRWAHRMEMRVSISNPKNGVLYVSPRLNVKTPLGFKVGDPVTL